MLRHFFSGMLTPVQEAFGFPAKMSDERFGELKDEMRDGAHEISFAAEAVESNADSTKLDDFLTEFYAVLDVKTMRVHNKFLAQCKNGNEAVDVSQALQIEQFYRDGVEKTFNVVDSVVEQEAYSGNQAHYEAMQSRSLEKIDDKIGKIKSRVMTVCREDYVQASAKARQNALAGQEPSHQAVEL